MNNFCKRWRKKGKFNLWENYYHSSIISQSNNLYKKKKNMSVKTCWSQCAFRESCFRPSANMFRETTYETKNLCFYSKGRRAEKWHTSKSWTSSILIMRSPLPECGKNRKRNRWQQRDSIGNLLRSTLFLKGESAFVAWNAHQNLVHHATELGAFYFYSRNYFRRYTFELSNLVSLELDPAKWFETKIEIL